MTEDLLRRHVGPVLAVGPGAPDDYELSDNLLVAVDSHSLRTSLLDVARAWMTTFGGTVELFEAMTRPSAVGSDPGKSRVASRAGSHPLRTGIGGRIA